MLVAFSYAAKPGRESEFESLLNDPETARSVARAMGALRNTLFLKGGRMIRILEFSEGARPVSMAEIAEKDPQVKAFLRRLGPLIQESFEADDPASLETFGRRTLFPLAFDVRL